MNSTEPTKQRKPRKPRTNPEPQPNPLEAQIKQARKAYGSTVGESELVPPNALQTAKEGGLGEEKRVAVTPTLPPLPPCRVRGNLLTPREFVNSLAPELLDAWAHAFIATGKRQEWLFKVGPHFGRENNRYRSDVIRELETNPQVLETLANLKAEQVMSDLQRRRLLKQIAHAPEHGLRGFADNLKAIELDAKSDPESNLGRRAESASGSLTFHAPVSLFFMPSTQARTVALESQPQLASNALTLDVAPPLDPPRGGG